MLPQIQDQDSLSNFSEALQFYFDKLENIDISWNSILNKDTVINNRINVQKLF